IDRSTQRLAPLVPAPAASGGPPPARAPDAAARRRRQRATELLQAERFTDALDAGGSAAEEDDADALLLRAVLLTNLGRVDEAVTVCEWLLAADDLDASVHYLMAL